MSRSHPHEILERAALVTLKVPLSFGQRVVVVRSMVVQVLLAGIFVGGIGGLALKYTSNPFVVGVWLALCTLGALVWLLPKVQTHLRELMQGTAYVRETVLLQAWGERGRYITFFYATFADVGTLTLPWGMHPRIVGWTGCRCRVVYSARLRRVWRVEVCASPVPVR